MSKRSVWTGDVLSRLQEAEHFLKILRQDHLELSDLRMREWNEVTKAVMRFAFGELSQHYRGFQVVEGSVQPDRGLYFYRLSRCLQQARRSLQKHRMPNSDLQVPEGFRLPDYLHNRRYERERIGERSWWRLFWSGFTFGKYRL